MIRMRKGIVIDYFLTAIIIISFIAFVVSCAALPLSAFIKSDSARIGLANLSMLVILISVMLLVMCATLLTMRTGKHDNIVNSNTFEQKYISLLTGDTKARREFVELYRKKESA